MRAETAKTRGLNRCFNRTLKYVFKGAATTVITKLPGSLLQQRYAKMLEAGTKPNFAKLTWPARSPPPFSACGSTRRPTTRHGIKLNN